MKALIQYRNPELIFKQVNPVAFGITENDRTTYATSMGDVIDFDAVLVTSSANLTVSPCFL